MVQRKIRDGRRPAAAAFRHERMNTAVLPMPAAAYSLGSYPETLEVA